ncbi:autorepressor SdpR family transcription factor [Streptococcus ovis]|uniref:autorepressor SdpR family transcription factor n=1 Tax=Streptococcus ovis TaxID=82806 RepID=UPI000362DD76|nr:autorepressor SdpR family transcription factor [Streptococcus ovis]
MSFANTFKALSNPVRREILNLLKKGRLSAGEIAGQFDMTGATISHHLSILKKADLIFETREKNFIYYDLNTSVLEEIMVWISDLKGENDEKN